MMDENEGNNDYQLNIYFKIIMIDDYHALINSFCFSLNFLPYKKLTQSIFVFQKRTFTPFYKKFLIIE
jgi:hypothetical protein